MNADTIAAAARNRTDVTVEFRTVAVLPGGEAGQVFYAGPSLRSARRVRRERPRGAPFRRTMVAFYTPDGVRIPRSEGEAILFGADDRS